MDVRLKQRLVGAAVLLALAVIVVPMFFSGHEQGGTARTSVSLAIPAQPPPPLQSRTLELGAPVPASAAPVPGIVPATAGSSAAAPAGRMPTVVIPGAPAGAGSAALPKPAPDMRGVQPTAPPPSAPARNAGPAPAAVKPAPAPAAAALPPGTAAVSRYLVSMGAYTDAANARALAARARALGFPVGEQTVQIGGRRALRIYAGPFANRALAEAARLRIHASLPRAPAQLIGAPLNLAADQAAGALPPGVAGAWVVQLGAFDQQAAAMALMRRARASGFRAYTDTIRTAAGTLWRVRVGPEASRDAALALRAQIRTRLGQDGIVAAAR